MFASDCLLAAVLLTAPADVPLPVEALAWAEACRAPLLALALDAQLLDPRENLNYLTRSSDAAGDLRALQGRFRDFAFAPLVQESLRFPDRNTSLEFLAFNRAYRDDLQLRLEVDPGDAATLRAALAEADQLYHLWWLVADTRWGAIYVTPRRQALQRLRDEIGAAAFYSGQLPPYVPVWRLAAPR